jgi:hypothetical protein
LPEQDRLLARVNTTTGLEFRLWFTRRLSLGLLPLLRKVSSDQLLRAQDAEAGESGMAAKDPKIQEFLAEFKKERAMQQADFKTPYKAPAPEAIVDEPMLTSEVQMKPLANGQVEMAFIAKTLGPGKSRELKMALDAKMMQGLLHLLEKSLRDSQWSQGTFSEIDNEALPDPTGLPKRPQYLN